MEIIGHKKQWDILTGLALVNRLPHALLFSGQDGLGKKAIAIELAKYFSCSERGKNSKPCGLCQSCQNTDRGSNPDFFIITPDPDAKEIKILQVRGLIEKMSLSSYSLSPRIAVVDDCHLMSQEAQSCFLKFLEEPRGSVILILISSKPDLLLQTILSRAQEIKFSPVKKEEIENFLLRQGAKKEAAEEFSLLADGRPGIAMDFLKNPEKADALKYLFSDFEKILKSDLAFRFKYAKNVFEGDGGYAKLREILSAWIFYLRRQLLSKTGDASKIKDAIKILQKTDFLISTSNANPHLAFEIALLNL
jgi:DNA polymerase III subunit delta'